MSPSEPERAFMPPQPGRNAGDDSPSDGIAESDNGGLSEVENGAETPTEEAANPFDLADSPSASASASDSVQFAGQSGTESAGGTASPVPAPVVTEAKIPTQELPHALKRRPSPMLVAVIAVGVVAAGGWGAFGVASSRADAADADLASTKDSLATIASELETTKDAVAALTSERDGLQSQVDEIEDKEQAVEDKEAAVKKREDDAKAREDAVKKREDDATAVEQRIADNTFGSGTFQVGTDIEPGTYRTDGGSYCYWARVSGGGGTLGEIIANDIVEGPATVTIDGSDWGFESSDCGQWTKVG